MKLSEALAERKDLDKTIGRLEHRLTDSARSVKGEKPTEDVQALRAQLTAALDRLEYLIRQINVTNGRGEVSPGMTITAAIARRDRLNKEIHSLSSLAQASRRDRFYGGEEKIRYQVNVDIPGLEAEVDAKSKELRELDNSLQRANYEVDLVEAS